MADPNEGSRTLLRIVGPICLVIGLLLFGSVVVSMGNFMPYGQTPSPLPAFLGILLLAVCAGMTRLGYMGAITRYEASEVAPAAATLTQGVREGWETGAACSSCGQRAPRGSVYCNHCGAPL